MTGAPIVAIVGRPNVGKSTLFNRLVGKRLALVDDQPGVTRDRREGDGRLLDLEFRLIDTAGYEDEDAASLPGRMRLQTEQAVLAADVALFMIDARVGLTPLDEDIARWLRGSDRPVILIANKAEGKSGDSGIYESFALGLGEPIALSAEHGEGLADLYGSLAPLFERDGTEALAPDPTEVDDELDRPLKLAIVGRPNAGKSTLINTMLGEDRLLTGPEAGITRDSIAVPWQWQGRDIELIDTAGMRKRAKVKEKLEKLSVADGLRAVDFAEVVVLMLDATLGLEAQDLKIADRVLQEGRALIIAVNKWDIAENRDELEEGICNALAEGLAQIKDVSLVPISAKTGKGIDRLLGAAFKIREAWSRRVSTGALNRWLEQAVQASPPPAPSGRRIKLRYLTQVNTRPPSFVIFGTRTAQLPESYRRYLLNGIRREFDFGAVPLRLNVRAAKNPYENKQ